MYSSLLKDTFAASGKNDITEKKEYKVIYLGREGGREGDILFLDFSSSGDKNKLVLSTSHTFRGLGGWAKASQGWPVTMTTLAQSQLPLCSLEKGTTRNKEQWLADIMLCCMSMQGGMYTKTAASLIFT